MLFPLSGAAQEGDQPEGETVNVELILDVSGSMAQPLDTGETRMDAAKRVLGDVISAIPDREGINVGLRIYGVQRRQHRSDERGELQVL